MTTLIFLLAIAILVLGPKKALELSRTAGEWYRKAEAVRSQLAGQLQTELSQLDGGVPELAAGARPKPAPSIATAEDTSKLLPSPQIDHH